MLKLDISILLVLLVAIVIALGALGVASRTGFMFGKNAAFQATTSPDVKIVGPAAQPTTPPSVKPDGPAGQ
jgi:hypothetical protein